MEWIQLKPTTKTIPLMVSDFASIVIPSQLSSFNSNELFDDFSTDTKGNKIIKNHNLHPDAIYIFGGMNHKF